MIEYIAFFVCLSLTIGTITTYVVDVLICIALLVGRSGDVTWNFTWQSINLMVWSGLTVFLWHYNFG